MGIPIDIEKSIERLKPVIEEAYAHVWETMPNLLLKRKSKDEYTRYESKQDYLDYQYKCFRLKMLKLAREGRVVGIEYKLVLSEEEE
jgi:hypothetical protein